ncbi:MAG: TatD family hydrolase, partial [Clostridia bacterium]|nr:TatD family hydrolase [Clostridia bacterium]
VTFKNATEKPDVIRAKSFDRILLETDCPYMTPVPFRGKTNFPAYVRYTCTKIAEILDRSFEEIDAQTTENAKRLFPRLF